MRLVVQLGKLDAAGAAKAQALGDLVSQAFFYELRTVQQLGYIVQSAVSEDRGISYLVFIVQSATSPDEVTRRIHTFVDSIGERLANTSQATFDSVVASARAQLLEAPKKLSSVADSAWDEVLDRTYRFGWAKSVAAALKTTTRDGVAQFWRTTSAMRGGGGRLLLQIYGSGQTLPGAHGVPNGYSAITSIDAFRKQATFW